jgi:hypothetical protein
MKEFTLRIIDNLLRGLDIPIIGQELILELTTEIYEEHGNWFRRYEEVPIFIKSNRGLRGDPQ